MPEPLLSGSVTPARYSFNTTTREVATYQKGHQDYFLRWRNGKLVKIKSEFCPSEISSDFVPNLSIIGNRIMAFFGNNQDIEWLSKDGKIHVLQARPIGEI
jgi:phosphoenolpyruvate synthase/pyruvate phosphate dikinase